jgi:hypothetical protein|tara:strand:- start:198 stop:407 length:210 start_codon:yes stop_codon:yes gene_type:complete
MGNFLTPITTRVRNAREGVGTPDGMEISMNADGTGGAVPDSNPSPAKCWKGYERVPGTKKLAPGSCKKK